MIDWGSQGQLILEHGPVRMTIDARRDGLQVQAAAQEIAAEVVAEFERVAAYMEELRKMRAYREPDPRLPVVLNKMIAAVDQSGCETLNTLGAVAGSFAEYAVEIGRELGLTRIIVNNGGDIALWNTEPRPVMLGIPCGPQRMERFPVATGSAVMGICTSGLSGRSFTKGIATGVTVLARSSSLADACATVIANETDVDDPAILRCLAEEIDSGTDIRGQRVTLRVGTLAPDKKMAAVQRGIACAENRFQSGSILGAVICLDDLVRCVPEDLLITRAGR